MLYQTEFHAGEDFSSLQKALESSRQIPAGIPRRIVLTGDYHLTEPLMLDSRDRGLTLTGGRLTGGYALDDWSPDPEDARFVRARLPRNVAPRMLLMNGTFRPLSVFPAGGFFECTDEPENLHWMNSDRGGWNRPLSEEELTQIHVHPQEIPPALLPGSTEIKAFHLWDESTVPIRSVCRETGLLTLTSEMGHPAGAFRKKQFRYQNLREGMNAPGNWYTDLEQGWIYYYPSEEERNHLHGSVAAVYPLIQIRDSSDITLQNMELSLSGTDRITSGLRSINLNGTAEAEHCRNLRFSGLHIHNGSGNGLKLLSCQQIEIIGCTISDMGAGGIFTHDCEEERIIGNHISDIGLSAYSSVGIHAGGRSMLVWVQDGKPIEAGRTVLLNNRIERVPYCGVTCNGGPHLIEGNTIIDCMQKLNDGGAFYMSRADRTVIRGNSVRGNVTGHQKKAYYFDEGSRGCICEGNESYGIETAYGDHKCFDMIVRNNHFEASENLRLAFCACAQYILENNIFACGNRFCADVYTGTGSDSEAFLRPFIRMMLHFQQNTVLASSDSVLINPDGQAFDYPL